MRLLLIMLTMVAGVGLAIACGGDDDGGGDKDTPTAEATSGDEATTAATDEATSAGDEATSEATSDGGGSSGSSFEDIPVPDGATQTFSGEFGEGAVPIPAGDLDSSAYGNLKYATYTLDQSADDVLQFYKDELGDWEELGTFSGGAAGAIGAYGAWSKDNQDVVLWIGVSDNGQGGSELAVYYGEKQ
jgi:hypothetical protein